MNYDNCDNVNSVYGANNGTHPLNRTMGNITADYWLNDANRLYLTGSYEQAAESYAKAAKLDPSLSEGWLARRRMDGSARWGTFQPKCW